MPIQRAERNTCVFNVRIHWTESETSNADQYGNVNIEAIAKQERKQLINQVNRLYNNNIFEQFSHLIQMEMY